MMTWNDRDKTVSSMVRRLREYADTVHGPTQAKIAAVEKSLSETIQKMEDRMDRTQEGAERGPSPKRISADQRPCYQKQTSQG